MPEKMEKIDDSKMFKEFLLYTKFLDSPKELTKAEKIKLKNMGIPL